MNKEYINVLLLKITTIKNILERILASLKNKNVVKKVRYDAQKTIAYNIKI
jgi:hypothetical protein